MEIDAFEVWSPVDGIPAVLYCEKVVDDDGGLRIFLQGEDVTSPRLVVSFELVVAYRNVNESYRLSTWNRGVTSRHPLYIVRNSEWIAWILQESAGVLDHVGLVHYAAYTPDDCIDIISAYPPSVSWVER